MDKRRGHRLKPQIAQIILLSSLFCLLSFAVEAAWNYILPPPQSEKLKEEQVWVNNSPLKTVAYRSNMDAKGILEFYKAKFLPYENWMVQCEDTENGFIRFSNEDTYLTITIYNWQGGNLVFISQAQRCKECEKELKGIEEVQLNDAPGKDLQFVPRYPGTIRIACVEMRNSGDVSLAYVSKDSIDKTLSFYRQNMERYNWSLVDEFDFKDMPEILSNMGGVTPDGLSLIFEGPEGRCIISVFTDPKGATIVGVKYNAG